MSINKLFAVLDCQPTTPNRLRGEARNGRRAIYVDRSRRPDGDLRDKPGCVPASGCTKGAPWRATRCIGADGSPVGGAQQRRPSPYLVSQEEKPSKSARGAGPPGTRKTRRALAERPGQTPSRGESVASSLARLAGEQPESSSPQGSSHQEDQDNQELSRQQGGAAGTPSSEADRTQF